MLGIQEIIELVRAQKTAPARFMNSSWVIRNQCGTEASPRLIPEFARIVTGVRRCGKSTLMRQWMSSEATNGFYLNFDDPRLFGFSTDNFELLDEAIRVWENDNSSSRHLYFDEIQVVEGWEVYVRQKLEAGYLVTVTGSNASLLSRELGTRLTGRHLDYELFPFSFTEFCAFRNCDCNSEAMLDYLENGGFPEALKYQESEVLRQTFTDILNRDIAVRYGIRDVRSLQMIAVYLMNNISNLVTGNKLATMFGIKAVSTIFEYLSHLEQCYLFSFIPKFSYSLKAQTINPKKVYSIDPGMIRAVTSSKSRDYGRIFENAVFLHIRRYTKTIYYYADGGTECDFVFGKNEMPTCAVQVCYELNAENKLREVKGLVAALKAFPELQGYIVTLNQNDRLDYEGYHIPVISSEQWFCQSPFA